MTHLLTNTGKMLEISLIKRAYPVLIDGSWWVKVDCYANESDKRFFKGGYSKILGYQFDTYEETESYLLRTFSKAVHFIEDSTLDNPP